MNRLLGGLVLCVVAIVAVPCHSEVRIVVGEDGKRHMYNTGRRSTSVRAMARHEVRPEIDVEELIGRHARAAELDADLVTAVIRAESSFDAWAVSHRGAMGLMQLMPNTADALEVDDAFDPEENVRAGTRYLRQMLNTFDDNLELALAAYNAGPEAVRRFGGIPPYRETVDYVEKVMRSYRGDPSYVARASSVLGRGRRTYVTRDSNGMLMLTTSPPKSR